MPFVRGLVVLVIHLAERGVVRQRGYVLHAAHLVQYPADREIDVEAVKGLHLLRDLQIAV